MSNDTSKMDVPPVLTHPSEVRALLAQLDFHPSRVLGQNFLIDRNILDILLAAADLRPDDAVVEVGPGLGVLTGALLERVATITAVEKDARLACYLRERFSNQPKLTLIHSDVLDCDLAALFPRPGLKLVANLPYAIAARLLVELTAIPHPPARMVITIQREVAARWKPGPPPGTTGAVHFAAAALRHFHRQAHLPILFLATAGGPIQHLLPDLRPAPLGARMNGAAGLVRHAFRTGARPWRGRCARWWRSASRAGRRHCPQTPVPKNSRPMPGRPCCAPCGKPVRQWTAGGAILRSSHEASRTK